MEQCAKIRDAMEDYAHMLEHRDTRSGDTPEYIPLKETLATLAAGANIEAPVGYQVVMVVEAGLCFLIVSQLNLLPRHPRSGP